ncbi:MAG TPA: HAD family hydrolase [Chitinophagaceae bacterium]|jgi:phosphoglycolate phosphatase|nr:HAD family hydrolase [Chitinophagaceae bacterium]
MTSLTRPDSLIFDMDGTLWDASDTYTLAFNEAIRARGLQRILQRADLDAIMGWEPRKAMAHLMPELAEEEQDALRHSVVDFQDRLLPRHGGVLYEGVREGLAALARKYRLFILSNCPKDTIRQFLHFTGLGPYITGEMAYGVNSMPKSHNMRLLVEQYGLQAPLYIGDTDGDRLQAELAGLPFVFVSYGFGEASAYALRFDSFAELTAYFLEQAG